MKTLKNFSQFISETDQSDADLIKLGLADPTDLFRLPIGIGDLDDAEDYGEDQIEGDLKSLEWLGYPDEVIMIAPTKDDIESIGPIGKLLNQEGDLESAWVWIDQVNTADMKELYRYTGYDWATYWGTEVNGKPVVVLDAPDGPYFLFSPADFKEVNLPHHKHTVRK